MVMHLSIIMIYFLKYPSYKFCPILKFNEQLQRGKKKISKKTFLDILEFANNNNNNNIL